MNAARVWLDHVDVTADVVVDDWPEWVETSVKGPGFFDWQVKSFEFRLHERCTVSPAYGQAVRILVAGVERFTGVVDSIEDAFSKTPRVVCQPYAVALKDVKAGRVGVDPRSFAETWFLELEGGSVQEACEAVLDGFAENRDERLEAVDWTVDVQGDGADPAAIYAPHGLTGPETGVNRYACWAPAAPDGESFVETLPLPSWCGLRIVDGVPTVGLVYVTRWVAYSQGDGEILYYTPEYGFWTAALPLAGPPTTNTIPLDPVDGEAPADPPGYSLDDWLAFEAAATTSSRIGDETAIAHAQTASGLGPSAAMDVVGFFDAAAGTWAVVRYGNSLFVTWWGNPLVQTISGRWANESMVDLLKLFAMVSGRWLKIEGSAVTLIPRTSDAGQVTLPAAGLALERDRQRRYVTPGKLDFQLLDPDDPSSYGLDYGPGRLAALNYWYVGFAGEQIDDEAVWPAALAPAGLQLLAGGIRPEEPGVSAQAVELAWSTDGKRFRVKTVQEGA